MACSSQQFISALFEMRSDYRAGKIGDVDVALAFGRAVQAVSQENSLSCLRKHRVSLQHSVGLNLGNTISDASSLLAKAIKKVISTQNDLPEIPYFKLGKQFTQNYTQPLLTAVNRRIIALSSSPLQWVATFTSVSILYIATALQRNRSSGPTL